MEVRTFKVETGGQIYQLGHFTGCFKSTPVAFGLRLRFASPIDKLSAVSRLWNLRVAHSWRQILDVFVSTDCDGRFAPSAERHGRTKFPIKSAVEQNASRSWRAKGTVV